MWAGSDNKQHNILLPSAQITRIRATNNAISCCVTPVVAFATFATFRACNGTLDIPSVFYALSLLTLPRLTMCVRVYGRVKTMVWLEFPHSCTQITLLLFRVQFFVMAIQSFTEMKV